MKNYLKILIILLVFTSCNNESSNENPDIIKLKAPLIETDAIRNINLQADINSYGDASVYFDYIGINGELPDMSDMVVKINGSKLELVENSNNHFFRPNLLKSSPGDNISFTIDYNEERLVNKSCSVPESITDFNVSTDPENLKIAPLSISEFDISCEKISNQVYYQIEFFNDINQETPTDFFRTISTNSINITKDRYRYGTYYNCNYIDITVHTVNSVNITSTAFNSNSELFIHGLNQVKKSNRS